MSQLFTSGDQSIGVSVSASVLPMNVQDWFPLGWTGWISLQSRGLWRVLQHHSSKASKCSYHWKNNERRHKETCVCIMWKDFLCWVVPVASHISLWMCVRERTFEFYPFSRLQPGNSVVYTIVTMSDIRSSALIYLITGIVCTFTSFYLPYLPSSDNHFSSCFHILCVSMSSLLFIFRFHIQVMPFHVFVLGFISFSMMIFSFICIAASNRLLSFLRDGQYFIVLTYHIFPIYL